MITLRGRVIDQRSRPIAGASVHAARTDRFTLTDANGHYELTDVPDGSPAIIAAKEGYDFSSVVRDGTGPVMITLKPQRTPPRSEYPRPDADRRPFVEDWLTLNGTWSFDLDPSGVGEDEGWFAPDHQLGKAIRVPFPYQSLAAFGEQEFGTDDVYRGPLSGYVGTVWYKRSFTVPRSFDGTSVRLKIGAANWGAAVWLDGEQVQPYVERGDVELAIDLGRLVPGSRHSLAIKINVPDVVDQSSPYPMGRRDRFTNSGGIWQSVWLEPVAAQTLDDPRATPRLTFKGSSRTPASAAAEISVRTEGSGTDRALVVIREPGGGEVARTTITLSAGTGQAVVPIPKPKLWDIGKPRLYTADVTLSAGSKIIDGIRSTFGLRTIERRSAPASDDYQYIWLNNRPIMIRGVLDQGFNPWGIHTPTGEVTGPDLRTGSVADPQPGSILHDLKTAKAQGFNLVRAHVKAFEPAYYHWADKLGLMIWYEMPSPGRTSFGDEAMALYEPFLRSLLERDRNHPSIMIWGLYNEGWGIAGGPFPIQPKAIEFIKKMAPLVRREHPAVLLVDNSACCENGHTSVTDLNDVHAGLGGYSTGKPFLDDFVAGLYPGSTKNFDEGKQEGQPWLMGEMGFGIGRQLSILSMVRSYPQFAGYVGVQLADQEDETISPVTYDRQDRGPMFIDHRGKLRGNELIHTDDAVLITRDSWASVEPGDRLSLPIKLSHFSDHDLSQATLHWKMAGIDRDTGAWVDLGVAGSRPVAPERYTVSEGGTVEMTVPERLRVGGVWVWLEARGKTVAESYLTFDDASPDDGAFDPTKPSEQEWTGGSLTRHDGGAEQLVGYGAGYAEFEARVPQSARDGGTLILEASSAEVPTLIDPIHGTGPRKHPTTLSVSINGKPQQAVILPDDPLYSLGFAARGHGRIDQGLGNEYGYRIAVPLSDALIGGQESIKVRLASDGGGLRLFGKFAGNEGARPRIVSRSITSAVPKPAPAVTDRPGVAIAPAALDDANRGVAVVSVTNDTDRSIRRVEARLAVPADWDATAIDNPQVGTLKPGEFRHVRFAVSAPDEAAVGSVVSVTATSVWTDDTGRHAVQLPAVQEVEFDPTDFPVVGVDDSFDTDTSTEYTAIRPTGEILPELTFGDGLLTADAVPAYFTLVTHRSGPRSDQAVVMVTPNNFVGTSPAMDGFFLGLVKDEKNYITAWTGANGAGGLDIVEDGKLQGYCCGQGPAITKGTQWAIVIDGNAITTWTNPGGGWVRAMTTSTLGAVDLTEPGTIQQYRYAIGFRGQNGAQAIQHFTGRSFPQR